MGRQYNYYISPEEDKNFMKYLADNGYVILNIQMGYNDEKKENVCTWETIQLYDGSGKYKEDFSLPYLTFIYKEEWGNLVNNKNYVEVVSKAPVIEQIHCMVDAEDNRLSCGRLYLCTDYKELISSYDTIYREYQKLVRVLKKNIAYKDYTFEDGRYMGWPSSQQAVDIIKSGCRIGI